MTKTVKKGKKMILLELSEVADRLGLKERTIRKYCRDKLIPSVKLPKCYKIIETDYTKFVQERRQSKGSKK